MPSSGSASGIILNAKASLTPLASRQGMAWRPICRSFRWILASGKTCWTVLQNNIFKFYTHMIGQIRQALLYRSAAHSHAPFLPGDVFCYTWSVSALSMYKRRMTKLPTAAASDGETLQRSEPSGGKCPIITLYADSNKYIVNTQVSARRRPNMLIGYRYCSHSDANTLIMFEL